MRNLYSIFDRKSNSFMAPVVASNEDEAVRGFQIALLDPNISDLYLKDLALVFVGHFDENTGDFINLKNDYVIDGDHWTVLDARNRYNELASSVSDQEVIDNNEIS